MTNEHASFEQLSDLADGVLPPDELIEVERHIAACGTCQDTLARLRRLLGRASSLSRQVDPPADGWRGVRERLPMQSRSVLRTWRTLADSWVMRAAAAILLVAGSSTLTVLALRSRDAAPDRGRDSAPTPTAVATSVTVRAVDDSYAGVVEELTTTLRAQRASLAPETVATLERTLRIIDEAIAEARSALAADPGNGALLDVLSANYEQKVQLLRQASELPART